MTSAAFRKQEKNNVALSRADQKKGRMKNLIPAKTGTYAIFIMIFSTVIVSLVYGLSSIFGMELDTGTKALINAIYNDFVSVVANPCIIMWGAPTIKLKINKVEFGIIK